MVSCLCYFWATSVWKFPLLAPWRQHFSFECGNEMNRCDLSRLFVYKVNKKHCFINSYITCFSPPCYFAARMWPQVFVYKWVWPLSKKPVGLPPLKTCLLCKMTYLFLQKLWFMHIYALQIGSTCCVYRMTWVRPFYEGNTCSCYKQTSLEDVWNIVFCPRLHEYHLRPKTNTTSKNYRATNL